MRAHRLLVHVLLFLVLGLPHVAHRTHTLQLVAHTAQLPLHQTQLPLVTLAVQLRRVLRRRAEGSDDVRRRLVRGRVGGRGGRGGGSGGEGGASSGMDAGSGVDGSQQLVGQQQLVVQMLTATHIQLAGEGMNGRDRRRGYDRICSCRLLQAVSASNSGSTSSGIHLARLLLLSPICRLRLLPSLLFMFHRHVLVLFTDALVIGYIVCSDLPLRFTFDSAGMFGG